MDTVDTVSGNLNSRQREAVLATEGPVLVLAGAGAGKTQVLVSRIVHILASKKAWPRQILAVTFTNRAAREMRARTAALAGPDAGEIWLGTFHALAARILRRHAGKAGLSPSFVIIDRDDQQRLIRQIIRSTGLDEKACPPGLVLSVIDRWKNMSLVPGRLPRAEQERQKLAARIWPLYQERLLEMNCCDFGDLIVMVTKIASNDREILESLRQNFRYILVDEYQDTNVAQYLWLRLLAGDKGNICCVGDDDQSIYGWRGAEVGNILRFGEDFPDATVIRLEQNYRSTPSILRCADSVISNNRTRLGKTLWTDMQEGAPVVVHGVRDGDAEAELIAAMIAREQPEEEAGIAVLVRTSAQTRVLEERFLACGIPFRVVGGARFYDRMEIRDVLAYLRLVSGPGDDLAFERAVAVPKRGIGETTLRRLRDIARQQRTSLFGAAVALPGNTGGRGTGALKAFVASVQAWQERKKDMKLRPLAELVLAESGYLDVWRGNRGIEAEGRLGNIDEFLQALDDFPSLEVLLEHVSLVTDQDTGTGGSPVLLMTLHAAKGLEFGTVFLPGWEEGLFPHARAIEEGGLRGLEEERRLAYVGLTRARQRVVVSFAAHRRLYGQWKGAIPSRFLSEFPKEGVEWHGLPATPVMPGARMTGLPGGAGDGPVTPFRTGDRVRHHLFGPGQVLMVEHDRLEVLFDGGARRKLVSRFVSAAREP